MADAGCEAAVLEARRLPAHRHGGQLRQRSRRRPCDANDAGVRFRPEADIDLLQIRRSSAGHQGRKVMKTFPFLVLVTSIFGGSVSFASDTVHYYSYVTTTSSPVTREDGFSIDLEAHEYWKADAGEEMTLCPDGDDFICFDTMPMSFAIPKRALQEGDRWSKNGFDFEVIGEDVFEILGTSVAVSVIESHSKGRLPTRFYYSSCRGLLAVAFPNELVSPGSDPNGWRLYFSSTGYGFPVSSANLCDGT
jgi:hypothetical protein